jgi:uncharacterized membrane-anchored protein
MKNTFCVISRTAICLLAAVFITAGLSLNLPAQDNTSAVEGLDWHYGPKEIKMEDIAEVRVPAKFVFLNGDDTRKLMEAMGNISTDTEVGLLAPEELNWFIVFEFSEVGYVKDDEKDALDSEAILQSLQEGNQEANKIRQKRGFPPLNLLGWEAEPSYNETTHNLEWATRLQSGQEGISINHNVRLLGRKGVMSATLVAAPEDYEGTLPEMDSCLENYAFLPGQKYEEFRQGDTVAKYGLTALVVGGAAAVAAKTGLLKHLWKLIVLAFGAIAAFFKRIFGKKQAVNE